MKKTRGNNPDTEENVKSIRPGFGMHPKYYVRDPVSVDSVVKGVNYIFHAVALKKVLLELPEVKSKAVPFLVSAVVAYFLTTENVGLTANFLVLTGIIGKFVGMNTNTVLMLNINDQGRPAKKASFPTFPKQKCIET